MYEIPSIFYIYLFDYLLKYCYVVVSIAYMY